MITIILIIHIILAVCIICAVLLQKSEGGGLGPFRENISGLWDWGPHDISMCLDIVGSMPLNIFAEKLKQNNNQEICKLAQKNIEGIISKKFKN